MGKAPVRVRGMNAAATLPDTAAPNGIGALNGMPGSPSTNGNGVPPTGDGNGHPHKRERFPHASLKQLLVAVVILAVGGLVAWYTFTEVTGGPAGYTGVVEPQASVPLDFTETGQITHIYVRPGQKVTVGEPLATLNQSLAQTTLQDAQAVLAADQSVVTALQSDASDSDSGSATSQAISAQLSQAQASLASAQTTVDQDKAALSALTLTSPIDGTVAAVGGIVGDLDGTEGVHGFSGPNANQGGSGGGSSWTLFPGQSTQTGTGSGSTAQPLIWLVDQDYAAAVQVGEAEIPNLHTGSAASLTVNALGRTVHGTVSQITLIPSDQNGSVEYEVTVAASGWPTGTADGMSLTATFP